MWGRQFDTVLGEIGQTHMWLIVLWCTGLTVYPSSNRWYQCAFKSWVKWWRSRLLGWRYETHQNQEFGQSHKYTLHHLQTFFPTLPCSFRILDNCSAWQPCLALVCLIGQLHFPHPLARNECQSTAVWTPGNKDLWPVMARQGYRQNWPLRRHDTPWPVL